MGAGLHSVTAPVRVVSVCFLGGHFPVCAGKGEVAVLAGDKEEMRAEFKKRIFAHQYSWLIYNYSSPVHENSAGRR